jgi:hypothetical protein
MAAQASTRHGLEVMDEAGKVVAKRRLPGAWPGSLSGTS